MDVGLISQINHWYAGKRVFVTGHTGFKGAWLAKWLHNAGANVTGYALPPETGQRNLFSTANIGSDIRSIFGDVCNGQALDDALRASQPEIVFHLAAQSLVRRSYANPIETYRTNVMGTAQVLESIRSLDSVRSVVVVTSDKCYDNAGTGRLYDEDSPMGGFDPYSSSKGCAELVTNAYRRSYFATGAVAIASARAGNVIGPGDWAEDRLIPDLIAAAENNSTAIIRNPSAVRPWQYVLDPLRGYLMLAQALATEGETFASGWNFGPSAESISVIEIAEMVRRSWPNLSIKSEPDESAPYEAAVLGLDSTKAKTLLGWESAVQLSRAIEFTVDGYHRIMRSNPHSAMNDILSAYWQEVSANVTS